MIRTNPKEFMAQVDRAIAGMKVAQMSLVKATLMEVNQRAITNTPVDTGMLRNSWYGAVNARPPEAVRGKLIAAGTGEPPAMAVNRLKAGDKFYFYNAVSYAVFVEFGTIHMAPRAMLRRAIASFRQAHDRIGLKINMQAQSYGWTHGHAWRAYADGQWRDNPVRPLPNR